MSHATATLRDTNPFDDLALPWGDFRLLTFGASLIGLGIVAAALVIAAMAATWTMLASLTAGPDIRATEPIAPRPTLVAHAAPASAVGSSARISIDASRAPEGAGDAKPSRPSVTPIMVLPPVTTTPRDVPSPPTASASVEALPPALDTSNAVPLPPKRPAALAETVPMPPAEAHPASPAQANNEMVHSPSRGQPIAAAPGSSSDAPRRDNRNLFERLFGALSLPSSPFLAHERSESGVAVSNSSPETRDRTAIYDIEAHLVYLPNGDRLEAHSGLGSRFDDPRYVTEKDRGATPPHLYDLELRAARFHGVAALRLNPVGSGNMFGRTGFLAHSYMLGPRGDSNGCVSFKDYPRFLQAFSSGEVSRLMVVTHLAAPFSVASARR